ncbi:unnamed protein product [Durusdinium trenchii]|uniref:Calmodulin n=1 Tax=Durusdinium trenchii TaxID=1381693 RepID=A0ABP0L6R3_9DINO
MPLTLESDDVDDIDPGTFVYWCGQDDDIPRDDLGEVLSVHDEKRKVSFPKGTWKLSAVKVNVSDFQKKTFVHVVDDEIDAAAIGQITELDNGKLCVMIQGKQKFFHTNKLMRCDFQPGMFAFWTRADDEIPKNHMGVILEDLNDEGRVQVKFPNGTWRFKPYQLVRAHVQPRSYVQWTGSDDDIPKGEIGRVVGDLNDEGRILVQFCKGRWRFKPEELFLNEMQYGCFVKWSSHDEDVKKGDVGIVTGLKKDSGRLKVRFPKGQYNFKSNELRLHQVQPGEFVYWDKCDNDIPRGHIGEVVRMKDEENYVRVQWPRGTWSMKPHELQKLPFQRADRVQWIKADDDIPEGHIGQVMGIKYGEDEEDGLTGHRLFVRFPKGRWHFDPSSLKSLNLDVDGVNELKATFKRFDKNGDGKLSLEELQSVLGKLGEGGGGLSDEECQELFNALDKDGNGKLTSDEFLDYVFGTDASGSSKKLLGDGFGLQAVLGLGGDDEEEDDDDDDDPNSGGGGNQVVIPPTDFNVTLDPEDVGEINGETPVSKAEWVSAMLTVGMCRAASVESFEGCLKELGQEDGEVPLKELAAELNGIGSAAGVEELRAAVGKVKQGKVPAQDLEVAPEDNPFEKELATKTGIDGLLFHLNVRKMSYDDSAAELPNAKLSALEEKVLGEMGDGLVDAVKEHAQNPPTLSAVSSWQRARENCRKEVQAIIDQCTSSGEKFVDTTWNPTESDEAEAFVMYVDKEKPGWDCTATKPKSWKRIKEVMENGEVVVGDCAANDIDQGSCGDCFLLGALGAVAANRKRFIRQAFVHYDTEIGVYGILFCIESHFVYEIIDDNMGMRSSSKLRWASSRDKDEFWVSILEKAYFKHHTCVEMCDGGHGTESIFCFLGGVTGMYEVGSKYFDKPKEYFDLVNKGLSSGELMTTGFTKPSKGKYAEGAQGPDGPCGEKGLPFGLIGGHCYSIIRIAECNGHHLLCIRNPWGSGEWSGPWSDADSNWTDEMKEALGVVNKVDGTFWMAVEDFVQVSKGIKFIRNFGPSWQCAVQRGCYSEEPSKARAKKDYQACDDSEITLKRGDILQLSQDQGYWKKGTNERTGESGFFRTKDVDVQIKQAYKFKLSVEDMAEGTPLIFAAMSENQLMRREWKVRKEDGMNYKDKSQPTGLLFIIDSNGQKKKEKLRYRHVWTYLDSTKGPWSVYLSAINGRGMRYNVFGYAPHGTIHLEKEDACPAFDS